jgi:FKBP-type peptidyl-prolyl cis-trans isomerase FkpA
MKTLALILIASALFSCNKQAKVSLSNDELKTFYTVGHTMGQRMKNLSLTDDEIAAVNMGLTDAAKGTEAQVNPDEFRVKIQELFKGRMTKAAVSEKEKGKAYLEKFVKEEKDVVKTESGLAFKILSEGTGKNPKPTDTVKVHYHGKLIDGTVFDSSKDRGQPITFPLNRVIKGWTEGVQKVKEGGKIKLVIPSDLAYQDSGAPPKIPGGATLIFDVELIEIVKEPKKK